MRAKVLEVVCAAQFLVFGACAADRPYLDGRFDLNFAESHWDHEPHMTDAFWIFQKDDGKTRTGYNVQFTKNGRLMVYYYDNISYDGSYNWLNDWYSEANTYVDEDTFNFAWKVQRDGMSEPSTGTATCEISNERTKITCKTSAGVTEVYEKRN